MTTTLAVRHSVSDYSAWRAVYEEVGTIRSQHGCLAEQVFRSPEDTNDLFITHEFPTVEQARAFTQDPSFAAAMQRAGVISAPRIEIFERV